MKTKLVGILLACATAASVPACTLRTRTYAVATYSESPPPLRYEYADYRPGFVYIRGNWIRNGDRWQWRNGYYMRERTGLVWVDGRWARNNDRYIWIDGGWRSRGSVVIRSRR